MFFTRPLKFILAILVALTCYTVNNHVCDAADNAAPAAVRNLRVVSTNSPAITIGHRPIIPTALSMGTIFVSTDGAGNACTETAPCELTSGIEKAAAGDVLFFRGGVYFLEVADQRVYLKGGAQNNPIVYESYPGEKAIFDGAHFEPTGSFGGIRISQDYTVLRNVEIRNMPNAGISIRSNYNRVEGAIVHGNHLSGISIVNGVDGYSPNDSGGSHNYVQDCIVYNNSDAGLFSDHGHNDGGNSDGIAISSGIDNHIVHNTVYANSDDGIDTWRSNDSVVRYNRVSDSGRAAGDGNGIKAGGNLDPNSDIGYRAFVDHNIVYANRARGIDYNAGRDVVFQYNTSYGNGSIGFATSDAYNTKARYNIAANNGAAPIERNGDTDNSWQRTGTVQFISTQPASPDFLKPTAGGGFEDIGAHAGSYPTLLFSSGFEGGVHLPDPIEDYQYIQGTDSETGFSWPINILGASESGLHFIDDDNYQALENEIQTIIGHNGTLTKALYNIEHYNTGVTQCPYEILNITNGRKDLYIKFWIKMDSTSLTQPDMWRTFFEWKTKDYAQGSGFRLIAFIYTDNDGHPFWHWQGDANPSSPVWEIDNTIVPVPMNEWFLTEFYWHWSEGNDGRALWKVNGRVIGDHFGPTTRNSKPIDFIMLTQIYGDANPKHQWIDDIEIWDGIPE